MSSPQPVTEAPKWPKVTATRKMTRPKKPEPKPAAAHKQATTKPKKKAVAIVETAAVKPTTPKLVVPPIVLPTHSRKFLISITSPS
jgi:hypothetical protein